MTTLAADVARRLSRARLGGPGVPAVLPQLHAGRRARAARDRLAARLAAGGGGSRRARGAARDPVGVRVDAEPLPAAGLVRLRRRVRRVRPRRRAARLAAAPLPRVAVLPRARREPRDDAREVEPRDRGRLPRPRAAERRSRPLWSRLAEEHRRTVDAVLAIVEAEALLDRHPVVQRSVRLRNPYVDPMNAIQVELLARTAPATSAPCAHSFARSRASRPLSVTPVERPTRNSLLWGMEESPVSQMMRAMPLAVGAVARERV